MLTETFKNINENITEIKRNAVKISVVIPVYNAEKYLQQCLESVLSQDVNEIEVICVNDCSTDGSLKILEKYKEKDSRIIVINNESNLRAGLCRNIGIEHATGEYIHFLDADDFLVPNVYKSMYETAATNSLDILRARAYDIDHATLSTHTSVWNSLQNIPTQDFGQVTSFFSAPKLFTAVSVAPWGGLFRRQFLLENNIRFNNLVCVNDRSFFAESIFAASRILFQDIYILYYRVNNSTSLVGKRGRNFSCHFQSYNLIYSKSEHLPLNLRSLYLEYELNDICYWLKQYVNGEYGDIIIYETKEFLDSIDLSLWGNRHLNSYWYVTLSKIISSNQIAYLKEPVFEPKLSVIMPVYNSQKFLRQAITSVLRQSFKEFELICVDDGSSGDSLYILQFYAEVDKRVSVFRQNCKFAGVARNVGINNAKGEYITFLDSDDIMMPDALKQFFHRAKTANADVVLSAAYRFTEVGKYNEVADSCLRRKFLPKKQVFSAESHSKYLFQISAGAPWGKAFRRKLIADNEISFPALPRSEDFCFVYWAFAVAERITIIDEKLIAYRSAAGNDSLESGKDRAPLAPAEGYRILKKTLEKIGKFELLKQSYINALVSSMAYNLRTFKTVEGFEALFNELRENVVQEHEIDFTDTNFFYNREDYTLLNEVYEADSFVDFLFLKMKTTAFDLPSVPLTKVTKQVETRLNGSIESAFYKEEVIAIRNSASYRIGRFITFIPRKIRGGIRCYREHGWNYTRQRLLVHLGLKEDPYK